MFLGQIGPRQKEAIWSAAHFETDVTLCEGVVNQTDGQTFRSPSINQALCSEQKHTIKRLMFERNLLMSLVMSFNVVITLCVTLHGVGMDGSICAVNWKSVTRTKGFLFHDASEND